MYPNVRISFVGTTAIIYDWLQMWLNCFVDLERSGSLLYTSHLSLILFMSRLFFNRLYARNCTTSLPLSFYKSFHCIFLFIHVFWVFFFSCDGGKHPIKSATFPPTSWVDEETSNCLPFFTWNALLPWPRRPSWVRGSYRLLPCLRDIL